MSTWLAARPRPIAAGVGPWVCPLGCPSQLSPQPIRLPAAPAHPCSKAKPMGRQIAYIEEHGE